MSSVAARRRQVLLSALAAVLLLLGLGLVVTRIGTTGADAQGDAPIVPASAPTPPPALPPTGSLVDAVLQPDGTVRVTHWLRTPGDLSEVSMRTPDDLESLARVEDLRALTSQGQVVVSDPRVGPRQRTLSLGAPTRLVRLDYTLQGVTQRSDDAPGRALVTTVALVVGHEEVTARSVVRVTGQRVLSLACSAPGVVAVERRPCGRPTSQGWRVGLEGRRSGDVVLAQADLDTGAGG